MIKNLYTHCTVDVSPSYKKVSLMAAKTIVLFFCLYTISQPVVCSEPESKTPILPSLISRVRTLKLESRSVTSGNIDSQTVPSVIKPAASPKQKAPITIEDLEGEILHIHDKKTTIKKDEFEIDITKIITTVSNIKVFYDNNMFPDKPEEVPGFWIRENMRWKPVTGDNLSARLKGITKAGICNLLSDGYLLKVSKLPDESGKSQFFISVTQKSQT